MLHVGITRMRPPRAASLRTYCKPTKLQTTGRSFSLFTQNATCSSNMPAKASLQQPACTNSLACMGELYSHMRQDAKLKRLQNSVRPLCRFDACQAPKGRQRWPLPCTQPACVPAHMQQTRMYAQPCSLYPTPMMASKTTRNAKQVQDVSW